MKNGICTGNKVDTCSACFHKFICVFHSQFLIHISHSFTCFFLFFSFTKNSFSRRKISAIQQDNILFLKINVWKVLIYKKKLQRIIIYMAIFTRNLFHSITPVFYSIAFMRIWTSEFAIRGLLFPLINRTNLMIWLEAKTSIAKI